MVNLQLFCSGLSPSGGQIAVPDCSAADPNELFTSQQRSWWEIWWVLHMMGYECNAEICMQMHKLPFIHL